MIRLEKQEITLVKNKTTKGTIRYKAINDDAAIRMVYVQKTGLPSPPPDSIKITLEE